MNSIQKLQSLGQSLWYDNIQRGLLENGELGEMIERGELRGITSNPSIFNHAIAHSHDYDEPLHALAWSGLSAEGIFDDLAIEDIRMAADLFHPLYVDTSRGDGYVSLEVNPTLAYDAARTIAEAKRLWAAVDRPNLMIKIPATQVGLEAIEKTIANGINVNVTLIFSIKRYEAVIQAYLQGVRQRLSAGLPVDRIASVASFFVSRVDTKIDRHLQAIREAGIPSAGMAEGLLGKAAVANAQLAYEIFEHYFGRDDFAVLKASGARLQRPLWASTSTKNPRYSDVKYVEELIAPHTVNTMPQVTLDAFRAHGNAVVTLPGDLEEARRIFKSLDDLGIDMDQVTQELEDEGVKAFADSYQALIKTIEDRRMKHIHQLGSFSGVVSKTVQEAEANSVIPRLLAHDATLWTNDPGEQVEIRNRLGWLNLPKSSQELVPELVAFAGEIRQAGFQRVLLLGMGGSSLAPEVMSAIFDTDPSGQVGDGLHLKILDSTDPSQVRAADTWAFGSGRVTGDAKSGSPAKADLTTLFIVSSKSGGTAEVTAFLNYFWERTQQVAGSDIGRFFIAITDPGTSLEDLAHQRGFRKVFQADPSVGGRNSALSAFGLVPAALIGMDLEKFLHRSAWMAKQCARIDPAAGNPGLVLGAILGGLTLAGRDKLTILADPGAEPLGAWLEQLIAESSGKSGKGILPVEGEPLGSPDRYGQDRLFVYLRGSGELDETVTRLGEAGHPAITLPFEDRYALGGEFYRWEVATAIACAVIGVNSFDQPDVQDSKTRTKEKITAYTQNNRLDEGASFWTADGIALYGSIPEVLAQTTLADHVRSFLAQARPGDYVAINAYLPREAGTASRLQELRVAIREATGLATTFGFGPRFLHSTGQLHKGGPNTGLFLLITSDTESDLDIPGQGLTFGVLQRAQALGDMEALLSRGRRVLRVHLSGLDRLHLVTEALTR